MKNLLKTIIFDQQQLGWKSSYVRRKLPEGFLVGESVGIISGIRRCGKSTLLHQIREGRAEQDFYFNFDDERLVHFSVEHFQLLEETFMELFGVQRSWYFDEIQNIPGWERFVRRLHDTGQKVFITGSNATMLSRELGTHLTGRYLRIELFPFSFSEFLEFKGVEVSDKAVHKSESRAALIQLFSDYSRQGGFPVFLREGNPEYLKSLYESILYRDVMVRNQITNEKELLELVYFLAGNTARPTSYNALTKVTDLKHPATVKSYMSFLEDAYLLFQVSKYDYSVKKQLHNARKIYFIDNALVRKVGFLFSEESGRLLENLVFLELRRRQKEVFYHLDKRECDFLVREGTRIVQAIQVCEHTEQPKTFDREIAGLTEAMEIYGLRTGLLLLRDCREQTFSTPSGLEIHQMPVWKWMLFPNWE